MKQRGAQRTRQLHLVDPRRKAFWDLVHGLDTRFAAGLAHTVRAWSLQHGSAHPDSMTRYEELKQICQRLGVHTRPRKLPCESEHGSGVWVVPILSWYHQSFDTEPDLVLPAGARLAKPIVPVEKGCSDFLFCKWPASVRRPQPETEAAEAPSLRILGSSDHQRASASTFRWILRARTRAERSWRDTLTT